jgi:hypothetical protein
MLELLRQNHYEGNKKCYCRSVVKEVLANAEKDLGFNVLHDVYMNTFLDAETMAKVSRNNYF